VPGRFLTRSTKTNVKQTNPARFDPAKDCEESPPLPLRMDLQLPFRSPSETGNFCRGPVAGRLGTCTVRLASLVRVPSDSKISWILWSQGLRNPPHCLKWIVGWMDCCLL